MRIGAYGGPARTGPGTRESGHAGIRPHGGQARAGPGAYGAWDTSGMARIVFIGVGDVELTRRVVSALVLAPALRGELEIVLHDDDPGRLATAEALVRALDAEAGAAAKIGSVFDRRQALKGAGFVVSHLDVGGFEATLRDFEIPHRYGLRQTIGDTIGIGGVFRGLRTIPVLVELAAQMAEECPDAWLLSCSDPMAMTGWAVHEATGFERFAGLCHSVCDTHAYLADLVGRDEDEVDTCTKRRAAPCRPVTPC